MRGSIQSGLSSWLFLVAILCLNSLAGAFPYLSQTFAYVAADRLTSRAGLAYTPDSDHPHAVDLVNGVDRYDYDANDNQTTRNKGVLNQEQVLTWDAENRLAAVTYTNRTVTGSGGGSLPATCNGVPCKRVFLPLVMPQTPAERYSYDADGGRVRKESKSEVTRYIGSHYEVTVAISNSQTLTTTKYYDFGGQRIAVRQNGALSYLHGDHLGSTSVSTNNAGATTNSVRYFAYGGQRSGNLFTLPTDHTFTGQKLDKGTGLLYYGARYYDSGLGMFISPDSIIPSPGNPQDLNRYSYTHNNPLKYNDPTGHNPSDPWHQLGLYNPYESVAMYFGVPDFSQDGAPAYEDLTTDIGKTYTEAFAQASQVINPPINLALNYTPGISAAYQLATAGSGSTIFGEKLSSSERALNGVFAVAGVAPVGKVKVAPEAAHAEMSGIVEAARAEGKRVVVIGETMRDRVIPFAESIGADWYKPRSTIPENWMKNNERWVKQLIKEGAVFIDIGEDVARAIRSEYYAMERRILEAAGYGVIKVTK